MTRRGTLVYYLSAWILGCFFMSVLVWIKDTYSSTFNHPFSDFALGLLYFYFFGLICGALTSLLAAFLLRQTMSALKCKTPSHWAVAGAIITLLVIEVLGMWGRYIAVHQRGGMGLLEALTFGAKTVLDAAWWLAILAGAITAYFLCRIQRAFAPQQTAVSVSAPASPSAK
jgi:hypothetical protein